jgi:hypothetical protein
MRFFLTFLIISNLCALLAPCPMTAQPPYSGTIFFDPDIITAADPSAIQSTTYTGRGTRTMFDRRSARFEAINAYLFAIVWNDGLRTEAQINPEFGSIAPATVEAEKYGRIVGQLPYSLRVNIRALWIHQGVQPFGGGNYSILIHTGQTTLYEKDGILEETLIHEAAHTSLDSAHATAQGWLAAQRQDPAFISTYAAENPTREDIAESFLPWLAVRHRRSRISATDFDKITRAIPRRLAYFDNQRLSLQPMVTSTSVAMQSNDECVLISPNPSEGKSVFITTDLGSASALLQVISMSGSVVITRNLLGEANMIDVEGIPQGSYLLVITTPKGEKHIKKWIKN